MLGPAWGQGNDRGEGMAEVFPIPNYKQMLQFAEELTGWEVTMLRLFLTREEMFLEVRDAVQGTVTQTFAVILFFFCRFWL